MSDQDDMVARMEALLAAKEKKTMVKTVMENGGGAVTGGFAGTLAAPLVVAGVGAILAPFTGGLSLAAAAALTGATVIGGAVVGHKMSKDADL